LAAKWSSPSLLSGCGLYEAGKGAFWFFEQ